MSIRPRGSRDPFNAKGKQVYKISGWRWLIFYPIAWTLNLWAWTWRFILPDEAKAALQSTPSPRLIITWHNRSFLSPKLFHQAFDPSSILTLISPSKMAAWEVAFYSQYGLLSIRGSSTRRSIQAGIEMFRALRSGKNIFITPDGPSGPAYAIQHGAISLAKKAKVPLLIVMANSKQATYLNTWDRHLIPWPFAKITINVRSILPDDPLWEEPDEAIAESLQRVCLEMAEDPPTVPSHG